MNAVPRKRERSPVNPPSPLPTAAVVSSRGDVSSAPAVSSHPDHVSVLIVNIAANPVRFLLAAESDGFWPLNGPVRGSDDESWRDAAVRVVKECTGVSIPAPSDILWIHRIEVPSMDENFSHILFCSRLSDHPLLNGPSPAVSSPSGDSASAPAIPSPTSSARGAVNVQWLTLQEVTTVDLRCSMLLNVLKDITSSKGQNLPVCGVHEHSAAKSLKLSEEKDSQGITRELLRAAKINAEEQRQIYTQFITRSRPHVCFKKRQFGEFMTMLGWSVEHLQALFRSFDSQRHGCLSFKHFIMGLAAVEPTIEHGGTPAEIRCRYIFRYYDSNQDNKISFREFRSMVADIRRCKGQTLSLDELQREAEKSAMVFGSESRATLGLHEFLTAVGQLKFRGTSLLLRSPISILRYLAGVGLHEPVLANGPAGEGGGKSPRSISSDKSGPFSRSSGLSIAQLGPGGGGISPVSGNPAAVTESPFLPPRVPRLGESFELAAHSVKVKKTGMVVNVSTLWDFEGTEAINGTLNIQRDTSFNRLHSFECFSDSFLPNDILKALRYFERSIKGAGASACAPVPFSAATAPGSKASGSTKSPKDAFTWGREIQKTALAQSILQLCHQVEEIFAQEPRLITITSPVYVLGDLHGNYEDLMCFEKVLWRLGPLLTPASFLFLGDYVDRGAHGLEVVSYLFAQKMVAPHKFFLLRGNHELRVVQKTFTFYDECLNAFGDTLGKEVWEAVNKAFDNMPLAAVIDKKIFCVHGGIPPPYMGGGMVNAILDIPCPLKEPEKEAPLAWEIMWNDPVSLETIWPPEAANTIRQNQGFGPNTKRGTAHVFSEDALQDFLGRNSLSHVIRAHEVQQSGFQLQPCGRCLTVFSSSHYCGASNEAACILCENMKLRVIRLDTA